MAAATFEEIKKKVRRLTRSLSTNILSEEDLKQYINSFILYDFPQHLRLDSLETTFEFYTEPYKDVYETSGSSSEPLFDFKNKYISVHPPMYVAGYQVIFSESREELYDLYPQVMTVQSTGKTGDGVTTQFSGKVPVMQNNSTDSIVLLKNDVIFSSIDANGNGLTMIDEPISATTGNLYVPGTTKPSYGDSVDASNNINYITGAYTVDFPSAPGSSEDIDVQTLPVAPSRPLIILYYDNKFTVRPVPDKPYKIQMNVFVQPTELESNSDEMKIRQWSDYIAYGASKKIFEDRMDLESVQMILPEFKKQEILVNRPTVVQQTSQRTSTIYEGSSERSNGFGSNWFNNGGPW